MRTLMIACSIFVCASAFAETDPFAAHCDRASQLAASDQHAEALTELEAAYAIKQPPSLLYALAKAHQRLGHAREALDFYRRYVVADTSGDSAMREDAVRQIAALKELVPQMPAPSLPPLAAPPVVNGQLQGDLQLRPTRLEERPDRGLIAGGAALLSTAYAGSVITGSIVMSEDNSYCTSCIGTAAGGTLLIPIIGPFISALTLREAAWSLPLALVDGAAQIGGLAMIIVGARTKHKVPVYGTRVHVLPFASGDGGGLVVGGRF